MRDGKPGMRIESASSVVLRDAIIKHMHAFGHVIRADRAASQATVHAYIDGLAGAVALSIAGRFDSKENMVDITITKLREAIDRDLRQLGSK